MPDRTLTRRQLNRALLARQLLLERASVSIPEALERLVGLQAQVNNPPYIGLWTRLRDFQRDDLMRLMDARQVVRATMMRSTIHVMTADDHLLLRPTLQPALTRALFAFFGQKARGLDIEKLTAAAREFFDGQPHPFTELRAFLLTLEPDRDADALAYVIRTHLALVQTPPGGFWGTGGSPAYALSEQWLGKSLSDEDNPRVLIRRYLAAFGPASVADAQAWSGITRLKEAMAALKPELVTCRDEEGVELYDLPDMPLPDPETPAPVRFMPEYDNLNLAHADRTRVIADADRKRVFLSAGRVRATILVDGFVRGAWKIETTKTAATLVIEPFVPLPAADRAALEAEGERLLRFVEDRAQTFDIRFTNPNDLPGVE